MINNPCNGESFFFLYRKYPKGKSGMTMRIGDEVLIHPIKGKTKAKKAYPAQVGICIAPCTLPGAALEFENMNELCLRGIRENKDWEGEILNEFMFSRLEFVKRAYEK